MTVIAQSQPEEADNGAAGAEKPSDPLTIKFADVGGGWWSATVETPDGWLIGTGPTLQLARDDLDWLLLHRPKTTDPTT